jgi:hypothetical protein
MSIAFDCMSTELSEMMENFKQILNSIDRVLSYNGIVK